MGGGSSADDVGGLSGHLPRIGSAHHIGGQAGVGSRLNLHEHPLSAGDLRVQVNPRSHTTHLQGDFASENTPTARYGVRLEEPASHICQRAADHGVSDHYRGGLVLPAEYRPSNTAASRRTQRIGLQEAMEAEESSLPLHDEATVGGKKPVPSQATLTPPGTPAARPTPSPPPPSATDTPAAR